MRHREGGAIENIFPLISPLIISSNSKVTRDHLSLGVYGVTSMGMPRLYELSGYPSLMARP